MTYFNGRPTEWWLGKKLPSEPITRIVCDGCAEAGQVPFTIKPDGLPMQDRPWRWAPYFGGNATCDTCHKPA